MTLSGPEPGVSFLHCPSQGKGEGLFLEITLFCEPFNLNTRTLLCSVMLLEEFL